ncbi:MAG: hypothetical protein IKT78_04750 [Ruminiclostridium sp.]|nr:hypothetical protein [Ruminiclostridium sp.]
MEQNEALMPVFVVISQTGTVLSRILKLITGRKYNHSSISFAQDLNLMYSFGRKNPYNPFWGGFVKESASFGTFKRFYKTQVTVIEFLVPQNKYIQAQQLMEKMLETPNEYKYNYLGLILAAVKINLQRKNYYYCSEFVRDMLVLLDIEGSDKLCGIIHPMRFMDMPNARAVYKGRLQDYSVKEYCFKK